MAPKKKPHIESKNASGRDRVGMWLYILYACVLVVSCIIVYRIVYLQFIWEPEPKLVEIFRPRTTTHKLQPIRGSILTRDGHVLSVDVPGYAISLDANVRRAEFADNPVAEAEWRQKARSLCDTLAAIYGKDSTSTYARRKLISAEDYFKAICEAREKGKGEIIISNTSTSGQYNRLMQHPFAREGKNKCGIIARAVGVRDYPYATIARSVIGKYGAIGSRDTTNIEVRMDHYLSGTTGIEYSKKTDRNAYIPDFSRNAVEAVDGMDVRTTLDLRLQILLDDAFHRTVDTVDWVECGTAILMDVETGAVRAMVNLNRDRKGRLRENVNLAFKRTGEPGSVFKSVASMALLRSGYVKSMFNEMVPTNEGRFGIFGYDKHVRDYQDSTHRKEMPMSEGLKVSSNGVFAFLLTKYFSKHPQDYYDLLSEWNFDKPIVTDIGPTVDPFLSSPALDRGWAPRNLGTSGYGYTMRITPMHIITFYNAIANGGRMMRPYFIESIEKDGRVVRRTEPEMITEVCPKELADTLTNSLKLVTGKRGTAAKLRFGPYKVAGKTGTSQIYLTPEERGPRPANAKLQIYQSYVGRKIKNQGTFVGFFPADHPKYTVYVTMYSKLSPHPLWGAGFPLQVVKELISGIYATEPQESIPSAPGSVPAMEAPVVETEDGQVPDVTGLALKDALYELERRGYSVSYKGVGHVKKQKPAAGAQAASGKTVELTLE